MIYPNEREASGSRRRHPRTRRQSLERVTGCATTHGTFYVASSWARPLGDLPRRAELPRNVSLAVAHVTGFACRRPRKRACRGTDAIFESALREKTSCEKDGAMSPHSFCRPRRARRLLGRIARSSQDELAPAKGTFLVATKRDLFWRSVPSRVRRPAPCPWQRRERLGSSSIASTEIPLAEALPEIFRTKGTRRTSSTSAGLLRSQRLL